MAEAIPDGVVTTCRLDGSVLVEASYVGGVLHGPYRDFWSNGRVSLEGQYQNGMKEGEWRFYDQDTGELREVLQFVAGREVRRKNGR
jgi:antitoxin component YwqK of YwqJK toxin-antitoxin module